ncbi:hypothetical protein CC1G_12890 [Coprinopsis cinerea okayama7|uniref:Uncharacterized protein n=1 Tax=Coprinopsis cinerea (strain Okayama-7 / 130 / ATCC MYA-4618 / FGSC 9003) TaxID=240176 RepID=A8PHW2_COPC7|nr:hypothetical protein CC1G_12890 [Coprinopsis cinerea okayama7\|eukprot:XP_001841475.1 hypothetical protein CC1G_12890 [Coprinopsis cinerea okayama7\
MARPRKYHTKAERKEANRRKNRDYYSRKKTEINKRRRDKHALVAARKELKPWLALGARKSRAVVAENTTDDATKRAVEAAKLFKDFENDVSLAELKNTANYHSVRLARFRDQVDVHYDKILNSAGIGPEFKVVEGMKNEIDAAVKLVEDIEGYLLDGMEALVNAFKNKELAFQ